MRKDLENTDRLSFLVFFLSFFLLLHNHVLHPFLAVRPSVRPSTSLKSSFHHRQCRMNTANNTLPHLDLLSLAIFFWVAAARGFVIASIVSYCVLTALSSLIWESHRKSSSLCLSVRITRYTAVSVCE